MNHLIRNVVIGSAATLVLVAGACVPAFASDSSSSSNSGDSATNPSHPRTLAAIQASAKTKTGERVDKLNAAITKVKAAKHISDSDRTTILGILSGDVAGMNTVEAKIAADTTVTTAASDYKTIFTEYRVYAVALPQARLAAASDRMTSSAIPKLTAAQSKLAAALKAHPSKSTAALQADLADMSSKISAASSDVDGMSAKVLAVTPSDFNSNHDVLKSDRASVKSAIADLKKAHADGKAVRDALK